MFGILIAGNMIHNFRIQALNFPNITRILLNRNTMAEQTGALSDVRLQFQDFFGSLSLTKRITILVVLGIVLIGMVSMIFVANRSSWAPLYSNVEPGDAAAIVEKLQENQIPYLLAPGGRTIMEIGRASCRERV